MALLQCGDYNVVRCFEDNKYMMSFQQKKGPTDHRVDIVPKKGFDVSAEVVCTARNPQDTASALALKVTVRWIKIEMLFPYNEWEIRVFFDGYNTWDSQKVVFSFFRQDRDANEEVVEFGLPEDCVSALVSMHPIDSD
jgi:hypothetical protein